MYNNGELIYILPRGSELNKCLITLTPASAIAQVELLQAGACN